MRFVPKPVEFVVTGFPVVLIENGKISKEQLTKCKIDINDLLQDARESGYFNITEINYAIMEPSGKISFLPKARYQPTTPNDMKLKVDENKLTANLVIDGNIMFENIKAIGHDRKWLEKRLNNLGYDDFSKILLVTCDEKEQLTVYKNDEKVSKSVLE